MESRTQTLERIIQLRMLVGYLGEKSQHNWWPTGFLSANSEAFLGPVFTKTLSLAQYHGVTEAARRVHDEHIGVGRVFHLFRLPETLEQALFERLQGRQADRDWITATSSPEEAADALRTLATTSQTASTGPVQLGTSQDLETGRWLGRAAGHYLAAFESGGRSYPYLVDEA